MTITTAYAAAAAPRPGQRLQLGTVCAKLKVSMADLGAAVGMSKTAVFGMFCNEWPARVSDADRSRLRERVQAYLAQRGATPEQLQTLWVAHVGNGSRAAAAQAAAAKAGATAAATPDDTGPMAATEEEEPMLLENVPLTPQARRHFGLARSPFIDEIESREDVWASASTRFVRAALLDAAQHHGFIAVIGESGSGKTTLREELEERIRDEQLPILVIKPYTLDMEPTDVKGKMMKSGRIAEAIGRALAPSLHLKSSPEARFAQVHALLRDSCRAGNRHLLVIEEAHRIPLATLKHLKGWMELKDGLRRLLGVCLVGQPELNDLLSEHRPEIREIVQRCEKVQLLPLDADLEGYLKHKFERVGAKADAVLAPDAYDALRARLTYVPRGGRANAAQSICYPLAVNNRVARAMNEAAKAGWPKVDANVIAAC